MNLLNVVFDYFVLIEQSLHGRSNSLSVTRETETLFIKEREGALKPAINFPSAFW